MNLSAIRKAAEQGEPASPYTVLSLVAEVERLTSLVNILLTPTKAPAKKPPRKQSMTPADRKVLCAAINAYNLPGPFLPGREKVYGADLSIHTFGGSHHIYRSPEGAATYIVNRTGIEGEYPLGIFTGSKWISRLADAVVAKFDALFPPCDGWAVGQKARGPDGKEFIVTRAHDNRPCERDFPRPIFIDLTGDGGEHFSADQCVRL